MPFVCPRPACAYYPYNWGMTSRQTRSTGSRITARVVLAAAAASTIVVACGGDDLDDAAETPAAVTEDAADVAEAAEAAGIRLVSATDGAAILDSPPEDLVILDVRTAEEFEEAHIDGAVMLDFYRDDFADQLAELDPDVPYLLYCRSGNRSGQTAALMSQLGFTDVADVDGGIVSWTDAGLPVTVG